MRVISGRARGVVLKAPDGSKTRPTIDRVKEAMFSIIQFELPGARILDLFGGTGQIGIEALSRGAKSAICIDASAEARRLINENLSRTMLSTDAKVIHSDYLAYLKSCNEIFDIIFLDPPYAEAFLENALKMITEIDILQSGGIIVTERPLGKELPCEYAGYVSSKDYKYGKVLLSIYRKE